MAVNDENVNENNDLEFNQNDQNLYFAAKQADDTATILLGRAEDWFNRMKINGYLEKLKQMYAAYHGAYYDSLENSHNIVFSGEQGELTNIAVNHIRNIAQNMLTLITSNRPSLQARATNTDYKSLVQTQLANGLLDYYIREKRLENYLKDAVEQALVFGSGYVKMEWNATSGEIYDINDETGVEIKEGDIEFTNLSAFDVIFDGNRNDDNHDWVLCRSFKNKFDIAAKYPELREKILSLPTKSELESSYFSSFSNDETELVPVYEFYHKRTDSLPEGRYLLFLAEDVVLLDTPMPYRDLPIYAICPSKYLGTPYGYSPLFDLLPLQDAVNASYSAILSNQTSFAVQNVLVPIGSDITVENIAGGMNFIQTDFSQGEPKALQLTATPKEVFDFVGMLERTMETLSGVSAVTRGNPGSTNLSSGTALALVQSMSLQFMSGLQQSYIQMMEGIGTGLINTLKDFASVPRIAMIVGKSNRAYMKEFTGDDLSSINRVIVDVGNPLAKCLAKDTPVLMYNGAVSMVQDIQVGELIMGPDSKPRTVESLATGQEMMYKVESTDKKRGISYTCNESHILTLKYCSDDSRYNAKKGDIIDISIRDYIKLPKRQKRLLQGFTVGVEFSNNKNLTVPAYILGAWLGDGHSATTALTTMDQELVNEWTNYAKTLNMQVRVQENAQPNKSKVYFITSSKASGHSDRNPFLNELRSMEVLNNKHIPHLYLTSSRNDRLELLAGLIDTDGSRVGETFVFTQKNDKLTQDVVFLAKSLGFRVTQRKVKAGASSLIPNCTGEYNKVTIGGNTWEIPTRLPRKQTRAKEKARDWLNYGITVTPVGIDTYYGFTLKEEPHFLLGDFTVTHNTTAGKVEMAQQLLQMGAITTPEQYLTVINTGQLDVMTEDTQSELYLIRAENERLIQNERVRAMITDEHTMHINEHKAVLADPDLRFDEELAARVTAHIQEHIDMLRNVDADLLGIIRQQPLGPKGGSPVSPQQAPVPPQNAAVDPNLMQDPAMQAQQMVQETPMPNLPQPPAPFENMPVLPNQITQG